MDGGDSKELHKIRFKELNNIANLFDLKLYDFKDDKVNQLIDLISDINPNNIAVPFYGDWHSDHINVMNILRDAINIAKFENINIIMYQVSVPIPQERITDAISMSRKEQKKKWNIFYKVYKTQKTIPWKRFQYNEYINGALTDSYAAEVYVVENSKYWADNLKERILSKDIRKNIYENLQDLNKVREIVKENLKK